MFVLSFSTFSVLRLGAAASASTRRTGRHRRRRRSSRDPAHAGDVRVALRSQHRQRPAHPVEQSPRSGLIPTASTFDLPRRHGQGDRVSAPDRFHAQGFHRRARRLRGRRSSSACSSRSAEITRPAPITMPAHLRYQACNDTLCFTAEDVRTLSWTFAVVRHDDARAGEPKRCLHAHRLRAWRGAAGNRGTVRRVGGDSRPGGDVVRRAPLTMWPCSTSSRSSAPPTGTRRRRIS